MMKKNLSAIFLMSALSTLCTTAKSQTIEGFSAENSSVNANANVNLKLTVNKNMQTNLLCGFAIDFGNGETREFVAGLNGNSDENMIIAYQFKQPGTYLVSVDGKFPITDVKLLAKALAIPPMCWGSKKTISITVVDSAPKKPEPIVEDDEVKKLKEKIAKLEAASPKPATPAKAAPVAPVAPAPKPSKANADSIL